MADRPERDLAAADDAFGRVLATVEGLTDAAARAMSHLPGWSRGHVLTHLARNADGNRNMVEGVIAGEERRQYPGGVEQREADIEAGAHRTAAALVDDLRVSQAALVAAWQRVPDGAWTRTGIWLAAGRQPITTGVVSRRRELLVHLVDLDLGASPADLPADFLTDDRDWLREHRTRETWPSVDW